MEAVSSTPEQARVQFYNCTHGAELKSLQVADPDVAVADRMVVVLQCDRKFVGAGGIGRADVMAGGAGEFNVVLNQDTVMDHSHVRGARQFS